jgi:hypothetical protein
MSGYAYGEPEPKERCPYCNTYCHADYVDVGVGYIQCGPYHCEKCGASEMRPDDAVASSSDTGWYPPGSPPGPYANVDAEGKHIPYYEADTLYRASQGVPPRYDRHGRAKRT